MAGERDDQINRAFGPCISQVMEGALAHGVAASAVSTALARSRRPIAAALFDARLGQILNTCDALGDIRDIFPWTSHGPNS
jgi:hypothetical protein